MLTDKLIEEYFKSNRLINFLIHSKYIEGETGTYFETKVKIHAKGEAYPLFKSLLKVAGLKHKEEKAEGNYLIIHIARLPLSKVEMLVGRKKYTFQYVHKPEAQVVQITDALAARMKRTPEGKTRDEFRNYMVTAMRLANGNPVPA